MSRWIEQKKKPVLPLYLAALVWPVVAVLTPIYQLSGILLAAGPVSYTHLTLPTRS